MLPNYSKTPKAKAIGNSSTIAFDVEDIECAHRVIRHMIGGTASNRHYPYDV